MLRDLAELVGPELALQLAAERGGQIRTYIPRATTTSHPWRAILGDDAWQRVVTAYGGERIDLPRGSYLELRKTQIIELAQAGVARREIARRVHVTERWVHYVLKGLDAAPTPRQQRLPF